METTKSFFYFLLMLLDRLELHAHVLRLYEWIDRLHRIDTIT
jgi:hypothetical protein